MDEFSNGSTADRLSRPESLPGGARCDPIEAATYGDVDLITASEEPNESDQDTASDAELAATDYSSPSLGDLSSKNLVTLDITASTEDEPDSGPEKSDPEPHDSPDAAAKATDNTDTPPPTGPPGAETTAAGEPDRGAALQQLCDFAARVPEVTKERIGQLQPPDAAGGSPAQEDPDVRQSVIRSEIADGKLQYGDALAAAGVKLGAGDANPELQMADPEAFASALQQVHIPEDIEARTHLQEQIASIADSGLVNAALTTVVNNQAAVRNMFGGETPKHPLLYQLVEHTQGLAPSHTTFAEALPDQAGTMAGQFDRLGVSEQATAPMRQLAAAHNGNLVTEWAAGYCLDLVGHSAKQMGVDRLPDAHSWDATYAYFEHLAHTAPDAQFTRDVRDTVLNDIDRTLSLPDPTILDPTGDPTLDAQNYAYRHAAREVTAPILQEAERRIRQILPPLE
jgi:hypothetical protein